MDRHASVLWTGDLKKGTGQVTTESGTFVKQNYSFSKRFDSERGTNPEELVAAAHAMCFSMALTAELSKREMTAESVSIQSTVHLEQAKEGWHIPTIKLIVSADVTNCSPAIFDEIVETTHKNCPISKLLNAQVELEKHLKPSSKEGFHPGPV